MNDPATDDSTPLWSPAAGKTLDVVGLGECSLDRVCVLAAPASSGAKQELLDSTERPGGQIATTLLACARLGLRCSFAAAVGDDANADRALEPLVEAGVDLSSVRRIADVPTRHAVILVEEQGGQRTVLGYRDPRLALSPEDLDRDTFGRTALLSVDTTDPEAAIWAARLARRAGAAVVLDAESGSSATPAELLRNVDFPIVSAGFAESEETAGSLLEELRELVGQGARLAIATFGERGALAFDGKRRIECPAFAVDALDTTGAGDAFRGGFIWALLRGYGAELAVRTANAVAAMNCRALGAQGGLPNPGELEAFLAEATPRS